MELLFQNDVNNITILPSQLNIGNNTVLFSVYDNTTMVRTNNHSTIHLSTISSTINKTELGISDLRSKQYDFTLYPNPAEDFNYRKQIWLYRENRSENN
jgi:hypothetical protein